MIKTSRPILLRISLMIALSLCFIPASSRAQSYAMTNLWSVAPGTVANPSVTHPFMDTNHLTRGLAYNPVSENVLVVSRFGSNAVHILNGASGAKTGNLAYDTNIISGGTFPVNMIGVADDGAIYVGNLTTDATNTTATTGPFRLYRWSDESAQPQVAYVGDPTGANTNGTNPRRVGDSLTVRGSGLDTQILLGTYNQFVYLLTTVDGTNFTARKISTDVTPSDSRWGITWGAGNTFWVKQSSGNLKQLSLDLVNNTATTIGNYPLAVTGGPLGLDLARNVLAVIDTTGHKLRLYDISQPSEILLQDSIKDFPGTNGNPNFTGALTIRDGKLFALESNNGISAYTLHEVIVAPTVTAQPGSISVWDGTDNFTFTVGATGTRPYQYQWRFNGIDIPDATNRTFTLTDITSAKAGGYSVMVFNSAGSATSATATVTVLPSNASSRVENIWNVAPDVRPYLTSGYKEYGVAINPVNTNVIVLTRLNPTNMLVVLDGVTGAEKHYIDYSGLPLNAFNGSVPMAKVDVADDGTIYIVNYTSTPSTDPGSFTILGIGSDVPSTTDKWVAYRGNPGPGLAAGDNVWGRTLSVRGGALDTEILVGSASTTGKAVAIFKPNASYEFTPTIINIPDAPAGFTRLGLTWGPDANTFWGKSVGSLILVEFDLSTGTGFVRKTYPTTGARSVTDSITGISYDPTTKLLAGIRNGLAIRPVSVGIYDVTDLDAGPLEVDLELFTTHNPDVEYQGQTDFAAGHLVALGVNNGVKMFKVNSGAANAPVIVTHPIGGTHYATTAQSLSVVADSDSAMTYQWFFNDAPILNATESTLAFSSIQVTNAGSYFVRVSNVGGGSRDSAIATVNVLEVYNTSFSTNVWNLEANSRPYFTTTYKQYGMSFNPANSNVLVVSLEGTPQIVALDGLTGAEKHFLDLTGITGGTKVLQKMDVADDGVVYAGNLTTAAAGNPFKLYRWSSDAASTVPTLAFEGDPGASLNPNSQFGYTLDARGSGANTEILLGAGASNVVSILTTANGTTFTAHPIAVAGAPAAFSRLGITFGDANTFWAKTASGVLHLVQYDLVAGTGSILKTYPLSQFPGNITGLDYHEGRKLLAALANEVPKNVRIYDVADLDVGPQMLDQELFATANASIEFNGEVEFGGNYLYALDQNNGLRAYLLEEAVPTLQILGIAAANGTVTIQWESQAGTTYRVRYVDTLSGTWQNLGNPVIATGSTSSYVDTLPGGVTQRFYRIVAE